MSQNQAVRRQVSTLLDWGDAHAGVEKVLEGIPPDLRGVAPERVPYTPWQLLEHLRLTQRDILEFCRNPRYVEPHWPDDYWPASAAPPTEKAWQASIKAFLDDRAAMQQLAEDAAVDLLSPIPHGSGQTILRELLLLADHNAYHLGELVVVRRCLGIWGGQ
ncbi:MAG: DinB family protein [Gemmatimonadales bacterium]